VSANIFKHWKFEESLIDVIEHCQNPQEAEQENQKAAKILHVVRIAVPINGQITDESVEAAKELVQKYELDMESFDAALEKSR
jgi:HD-like signal output (HDOD) protein